MKKTFIAICCIAFMFSFSSAAFATQSSQADDFGTVTITVVGVTGTDTAFTFDPSPSVGLSITTTDADYAITSANSLTSETNGQEYGTKSTATGYAQRDKTTAKGLGPVATASATALPGGGDWNWQGGS